MNKCTFDDVYLKEEQLMHPLRCPFFNVIINCVWQYCLVCTRPHEALRYHISASQSMCLVDSGG